MITITPSNLLRKYVGETSQLMKAVFSLSKKLSPCIIFIDEMDSMFRSRVEDDHPVLRNLQTECMCYFIVISLFYLTFYYIRIINYGHVHILFETIIYIFLFF